MANDTAKVPFKSHLMVRDLASLPKKDASHFLTTITSIEKKSFPSNEAFSFDTQLLTKSNTRVLYVTDQQAQSSVLAYSVCVRFRRTLLLHKICVAERFRNRGVGKYLMAEILDHAERGGCASVELWVDSSRFVARTLYLNAGLREEYAVHDYYAPGRDGIKMSIQLPRDT